MRLKLIRLSQDRDKTQKLGKLYLFNSFNEMFACFTLEPFACIPSSHYLLKKYQSPKLKRQVFLFDNVPNKSYIEIHNGNFRRDSTGCILVGSGVTDIDKDGKRDVINSNATLDKLLSLCPNEIQIDVFENPKDV